MQDKNSNLTIVLCLWVRGHVDYRSQYVVRLEQMVKRLARSPIRFIAVTDQPQELPVAMEKVVIRPWVGPFAWWNKVRLFDPNLGFEHIQLPKFQTVEEPLQGRIVYYDLDTLPLTDPAEIASYPAPFALAPHGGHFNPRSHEVVRRFNSSVMTWNAGEQAHVFEQYRAEVSQRYWGDQDWIGTVCPFAATMPAAWFPRLSELALERAKPPVWPSEAKVILCKKPKNHQAIDRFAWFDEAWR